MDQHGSTIFAQATGAGRAGVAVFRLSGPRAGEALDRLTGARGEPRLARYVTVRGHDKAFIDQGLALWFPAPASFTGEDVAELHLHGSPAVALRLADELEALGLEQAGPGAFTMRAFANGKMDLTQTEGLAELLEAETRLQHRQATDQLRGKLRCEAETWRADLIAAMALLEAAVDFPDEEDIAATVAQEADPIVERLRSSLEEALVSAPGAQLLASALRVAIIGPPNAGKSTLFNALLKQERAIVSPEPGTTRDIVTARVDWAGYAVELADTAGLRDEVSSAIEKEGIKRATAAAEEAQLRLICWPLADGPVPPWLADYAQPGDLILRTKSDEGGEVRSGEFAVASRDQKSLSALIQKASERFAEMASPGLLPTTRQQKLVGEALSCIHDYEKVLVGLVEARAECLRLAARRLEMLTGRIAPDDVLDDIFSSFCIGK